MTDKRKGNGPRKRNAKPSTLSGRDPEESAIDRTMAMIHYNKAHELEANAGILIGSLGLWSLARIMHVVAGLPGNEDVFVSVDDVDWTGLPERLGVKCSPERLSKLWAVFDWLGMLSIKVTHEPDWERLDEVYAALTDTQTDTARRRNVLREVATAIDDLHGRSYLGQRMLAALKDNGAPVATYVPILAKNLRDKLRIFDHRFAKLPLDRLEKLLQKTAPADAVKKGGAGRMAPALLAARLTVMVSAFDDTDEAKTKKRYLAAEQSAKR